MTPFHQSPRDADFIQSPWAAYDRARAGGPLVFWHDYGHACSADHATVSALLRDRRFGREAPAGLLPPPPEHLAPFYAVEDHSMLEREPPVHTRLRGLVTRAFVSRRVAGMAAEIAALSARLIDGFSGAETDLLPHWAERIPVIVIARLLGVPEEMAGQLLAWSHDMVAIYQARRDRAVEEAAARAAAEFSAYLRAHVEARRRQPREDLITHLIAAEENGDRLSTDELIATCILLLNAGHEATVHALGNGVKAVLESGRPAERFFANAAATEATVEEILRFDPPLHMFTRYALEPVEIAGHRFAPGEVVGLLLGAANHDPAFRRDPGRFDPGLGGAGHLSFGAGLHFCVGAPLARLEMQVALPDLFRRLPGLRLARPPRYADAFHFRRLERLEITA
ncbi:cytochrome P450 [Paroceanicella profunda]|uniref:Cytochrome P450 n=1 Tax=Paroceanicella profunda TaxID=2579971 RepID=A0A5B8FIE3_9RHOB|nr:cytochrome P450 [Paroceanicella profunda]QDL92988.1 cytochrome P450 [Paroceanicella profunda]